MDEKIIIKENSEVALGKKKIFKSHLKSLDELSHWERRFHLILGMTDIFYNSKKEMWAPVKEWILNVFQIKYIPAL